MKPIKSTDPKKKVLIDIMKQIAQADKITSVKQDYPKEVYYGRAFKYTGDRKYENVGRVSVDFTWMETLEKVTFNPEHLKLFGKAK